jgi:transposase
VSDLFGASGRRLLDQLALPQPWAGTVAASLRLIDELQREIAACEAELARLGADHRYVPLLLTIPGIAWVLAYTIAAEIGDIGRFPSPKEAGRLHRPLPARLPVGRARPPRPALQARPKYLRWALIEATTHACRHPAYRQRYRRTSARLGRQRGPKVAQVELARRLAEAIWHMLTRDQAFAPAGAPSFLAA